jgi:hypothetical protein
MGYQCTATPTCLAVGFGGFLNVRPQPLPRPKLEKYEKLLVSLALLGIAAVTAFLLVYFIAKHLWRGG